MDTPAYNPELRQAIIGYLSWEFDCDGEEEIQDSDPYNIPLLYTTVDNYNFVEHDLQLYADAMRHVVTVYLNNDLIHAETFADAESMAEFFNSIDDLNTLYSWAMDYVREYDPSFND